VLVDRVKEQIVGTSMIVSQLGRRGAPYIYFDVIDEERYSATIDRHFYHTLLRIGYSYDGPTEIGGLVIMPDYRRASDRLGTFISYVRFMFLAAHRAWFQSEVLAELMPPLEPDGTSHLWEALGRRFTGLSYAEADRLSKKNKEFIKGLFPEGVIHATLMPEDAQKVIGKTGAQTRGVEKLLQRIGFRYAHRVDPFDGGPHFTRQRGLVAVELDVPPFFRAIPSEMSVPPRADDAIALSSEAIQALELRPGREVIVLPFS
jgi:arginine N-succinyltransferase